MAAVVRVKRRIDEDPADSLLLCCKRIKSDDKIHTDESLKDEEVKSLFKFAATVKTKESGVSNHVRDAIKREKLQREYKHHQVDVVQKTRQTKKSAISQERFKVISSHRAIDLSSLDERGDGTTDGKEESKVTVSTKVSDADESVVQEKDADPVDENKQKVTDTVVSPEAASLFCLYDIEHDAGANKCKQQEEKKSNNNVQETVMCNDVPMIREKVTPNPHHQQFVYDIYYTNSADLDFRALENILAVEALREEYVFGGKPEEEEVMFGEDEDSNDEDNWRNDYPDEDPRIYGQEQDGLCFDENDAGYGYHDYHMDHGVSDMLGHRLKICDEEELSSEDEDFAYFNQPLNSASAWSCQSSYDSYQKRIMKELREDYEEDEMS